MTSLKKELWKDVVGYEGYYMISNYGNVKSKLRHGNRGEEEWLNIKPYTHPYGYEIVDLRKNGTRKTVKIHRLVAIAFLGESDLQVNHKNGIRNDNRLDNLEWVTPLENMRHSFDILKRDGSMKDRKHSEETKEKMKKSRMEKISEGSYSIKVTIDGVEYISVGEASRALGVYGSTIGRAIEKGKMSFKGKGVNKGKIHIINAVNH